MKLTPFWTDNYPRPADLQVAAELPSEVDVAIIGGGYTGLSAARTLAKSGASVAVLERETIGYGASSRNGGITGSGLKKGAPAAFKAYGEELGRELWQASLDALALVKELVEVEGIDCDFQQNGDLCVAYKPSHYEGFKQRIAWYEKNLGHSLRLIPPSELRTEIGSDVFFGGMAGEHGAGLHPAKLVFGLAEIAARNGAFLCENAAVTHIEKTSTGFTLQTPRGAIRAKEVLAATNGYTDMLVKGLKPRVLPVGSYIIITEPLSPELQNEISPRGRMFYDSKWFLNYLRLTPDGRMLWGGRTNLSTDLDLNESIQILQPQMLHTFPQLKDIPITHSWTGKLGVTFDLMPHIGRLDGVHYALGHGGHGLHTALYLGREVAQMLIGEKSRSPFAEIPHQTYFFYRNRTWFLPYAAMFYRIKDWLS